ncbi:clp protease ATP-binding subunit ClpC [Firmicutes bacterium CAG:103]|nr:clp protease ATP-binding subunit ClpC [Firmicutes bacterium CAG:103]
MQPTLCSRCKKNVAVIFITRIENGESHNEGLCLRCARELHIKPVDEMMEKLGISDADLDNLTGDVAEMLGSMGMLGGDGAADADADASDADTDEDDGKTATFPFLNRLFNQPRLFNQNPPPAQDAAAAASEPPHADGSAADKRGAAPRKLKFLNNYCIDLTQRARDGKLDAMVGRAEELERVIQILNRRQKNNPCLIGEPGVGKTAIAEGLAQRIAEGNVPYKLRDKQVYLLDLTALVAGTQFRGQFESRMKGLIEEIRRVGNIILVIDEVHNIVGAGDAEGSMNAANILKPALSRGEIQVIGATTFAEYRKHIEKDAALERRFQPVTVAEPSIDDSVEILKGVRRYYEDFHGVVIPDDMCRLAVVLSERYITDRFLPDKAIDLIDEACSDVNLKNPDLIRADEVEKEIGDYARERELLASAPPKTGDEYDEQELDRRYERIAELRSREMQLQTELDALRAKGRPELTADNLARIIELWTKIPAASIRADEFEQLAGLGDRLRAHIVGQDQAIDTVCAAIRRNRVGLQAKRKPVSFLFVGGTGVGKTELVKRLADELFHAPESLIRLDMSEYMEKFSVSRMIGSPPGYVGYDEAGQLTEKIRRRPYSVVLFDEIEKAHPDVMNLLLQILDDGRITDAQGRTVNFENTVIIMTTNAGSNTRTGALGFGLSTDDQSRERAQRALNEFLRPEFLNRIDEIVYFNHLTEENFRAIAALMLDEVRAAMAERGMTLHWTPAVIDYLVRKGYSETYGARNLRRTIQRDVEDAIASAIVARRKAAGDIGIDAQDDHITVTINDREVNA